jgi:hypothetical protein
MRSAQTALVRQTGNPTPRQTGSWRARVMGLLAALAMTAGVLTATAAPASAAAMSCNHDNGASFNACLTIEYAGGGKWNVNVGFDRYMPQQYALEIIGCGARMFAVLWGDDGGHPEDDNRGVIDLRPGSPTSGNNPQGLFAEFSRAGMNLNEDDGRDEVYAEITYFDCHNGQWFTYRTGTHVGNF